MGTWNETCMISQLAITSGSKVVAFIVKSNAPSHLGNLYEAESLYAPTSFAMRGIYNDTGIIRDIEESEFHWSYLKKYEEYEDYNSLTELLNKIQKEKIKEHSIVMIHEKIYDTMISYMEKTKRPDIKQKMITAFKEIYDDEVLLYMPNIPSIRMKNVSKNKNSVLFHLNETETPFIFISELLMEPICIENDNQYEKWFIELILFNFSLDISRKSWMTQIGTGSSNEEYALHAILAKEVCNHITDKKKQYEKYDDEYSKSLIKDIPNIEFKENYE